MRSCTMRKALHAYRGAERAVGSGSGACGAVRGVTPFLRVDPVYQQAAEAGASALAAMRMTTTTTRCFLALELVGITQMFAATDTHKCHDTPTVLSSA